MPIVSVSKGLEVGSGRMMSELIPSALGRKQPAAFLSGPSFAKEVMDLRPTGVVAASKVRCRRTLLCSPPGHHSLETHTWAVLCHSVPLPCDAAQTMGPPVQACG